MPKDKRVALRQKRNITALRYEQLKEQVKEARIAADIAERELIDYFKGLTKKGE